MFFGNLKLILAKRKLLRQCFYGNIKLILDSITEEKITLAMFNPIPTVGGNFYRPSYTFLNFSETTNAIVLKFFDFSFISISYVFA